jgi:hypothetical protein
VAELGTALEEWAPSSGAATGTVPQASLVINCVSCNTLIRDSLLLLLLLLLLVAAIVTAIASFLSLPSDLLLGKPSLLFTHFLQQFCLKPAAVSRLGRAVVFPSLSSAYLRRSSVKISPCDYRPCPILRGHHPDKPRQSIQLCGLPFDYSNTTAAPKMYLQIE